MTNLKRQLRERETETEISELQTDHFFKALPYMATTLWRKEEVGRPVGTKREQSSKALWLYGMEKEQDQRRHRPGLGHRAKVHNNITAVSCSGRELPKPIHITKKTHTDVSAISGA